MGNLTFGRYLFLFLNRFIDHKSCRGRTRSASTVSEDIYRILKYTSFKQTVEKITIKEKCTPLYRESVSSWWSCTLQSSLNLSSASLKCGT